MSSFISPGLIQPILRSNSENRRDNAAGARKYIIIISAITITGEIPADVIT